jgi:hypothetical protein
MNILFAWEQGEGYGHFSGIYPVARAMPVRALIRVQGVE